MAEPGMGWAMLAAGAAGQGAALWLARRSWALLRTRRRIMGTVVGHEAMADGSGSGPSRTWYLPRIDYVAGDGHRRQFVAEVGRRVAEPVGRRLPLLVDARNPSRVALASFRALWLFPLVTSLLSLPFCMVGLWVLLAR